MRRLRLFLLAWALPAALWAADTGAPQARLPVQLSLPLGGPAAVNLVPSLPGTALSASVPGSHQHVPESVDALPAQAAPAPASMPALVAQALKAGDAHAFYQAVAATGYDLPRGDDHQERLLREGAERAAADRAFFDGARGPSRDFDHVTEKSAEPARPAPAPAKKRPAKIDYETFGRLLALTPRLSESPFRDTEAKRRILLAAGYTHLIGPGGRRIPLPIADEARVGRAFEHTLATYRRRP